MDPETIDIILVTYKRLHLLKRTVKAIYRRTKYPHRLWVVNNGGDDETATWLKRAKLHGYVHDYILADNGGQAQGQNLGLDKVQSKYFVVTQDDLVPPDLQPCWLERLLHLAGKYPEYAGISMRIERIRHRDVDENKELIESPTSLAAVFRIMRLEDAKCIDGFGKRPHWESTEFMRRTKPLKKKLAVATHLYASHIGFMPKNKGFAEGFTDYKTYSPERVTQGEDQPYPDIDPKTNIPLNVNTPRDAAEQARREAAWKFWGSDMRRKPGPAIPEHKILAKYVKGVTLEVGCGSTKVHPATIGMDVYPSCSVDIVGDIRDLWMFEDESVDVIVASHVLEHLTDAKSALKEWYRVLKPEGVIAIAVPDGDKRPGSITGAHKAVFPKETLRVLFKRCLGMKVLQLENAPDKPPGKDVLVCAARKRANS